MCRDGRARRPAKDLVVVQRRRRRREAARHRGAARVVAPAQAGDERDLQQRAEHRAQHLRAAYTSSRPLPQQCRGATRVSPSCSMSKSGGERAAASPSVGRAGRQAVPPTHGFPSQCRRYQGHASPQAAVPHTGEHAEVKAGTHYICASASHAEAPHLSADVDESGRQVEVPAKEQRQGYLHTPPPLVKHQ